MGNPYDDWVISGRSISKDGKPAVHWTLSCRELVNGRGPGRPGRPFKRRSALGKDLYLGIQRIVAAHPMTKHSAQVLIRDVSGLLVALDELEAASGTFTFSGGVEALPGACWFLFTRLLDGSTRSNVARIYSQCRRVAVAAARVKFGELPPNFLLPGNPFKKSASGNWNKLDDLGEKALREIADLLKLKIAKTTHRLDSGRRLLPQSLLSLRPNDEKSPRIRAATPEDIGVETNAPEAAMIVDAIHHRLVQQPGSMPATTLVGLGRVVFSDAVPNQVKLYQAFGIVDRGLGITDSRFTPHDTSIATYTAILRVVTAGGPIDIECLEQKIKARAPHPATLKHCRWLANMGALADQSYGCNRIFYAATSNSEAILAKLMQVQAARAAVRLNTKATYDILTEALPTYEDLYYALALFLMRSGFNTSTAIAILPYNWHAPHTTAGDLIEVIHARKPRANGKRQETQSNKFKEYHAYDLIVRVLEWTEPLRCLLRQQIKALDGQLADKCLPAEARRSLWKRRQQLVRLTSETWLYLCRDGEVRRLDEIHWDDLQQLIADAGIVDEYGQTPSFNQRLTRRAWANFVYEKSGANLIVTKAMLGHGDLGSLLTYIARQAELNRNRRDWVKLQTSILSLLRTGSLTAPAVRELVQRGELTPAQGETLLSGRALTKSGVLCSDARAPDKHVDPGHKPGELCKTQDCLKGCGRAFVTFETAHYLARVIEELNDLCGSMSVPAWAASDYPHDLAFAQDLFGEYAPAVQKAAITHAKATKRRPVFGVPTAAALRATRFAHGGQEHR